MTPKIQSNPYITTRERDDRTEDLVLRWSRGLEGITLNELYDGVRDGKQIIPAVDTRQAKLVELTVNAGIETLVHLYLSVERETVRFDRLPLSRLLKKEARPILEEFFNNRDPNKNVELTVRELKNKKLINTANDLISGTGSEQEKDAAVKSHLKEYDLEVARYRAARDLHDRLMIYYNDGRLSRAPEFRRKLPVEPRVEAFNRLAESVQEALIIIDAGQKNKEGASQKLEDIGGNVLALKDVNRICVVPKFAETAGIFSQYLQNQLETIHVRQTVSNDEGWQISKTGALDRKILIALPDYIFDSKKQPTTKSVGTLAEVKIQSSEMLEADEISHLTYDACRQMAGRGKKKFDPKPLLDEYNAASDTDKSKTRLQQLFSYLEVVEHYYEEISEHYKFSMEKFPRVTGKSGEQFAFTENRAQKMGTRVATVEDLNDPRALKILYDNMVHFTQHLFMSRAQQHRNKDWVKLYVNTAFEKIAELTDEKTKYTRKAKGPNPVNGSGATKVAIEQKLKTFIDEKDLNAMVADLDNKPTLGAVSKRVKGLDR